MAQVETVTQSSDNFASNAKPAPNASTTLQDSGADQTPNLASTLPGSLDQVSLNTFYTLPLASLSILMLGLVYGSAPEQFFP